MRCLSNAHLWAQLPNTSQVLHHLMPRWCLPIHRGVAAHALRCTQCMLPQCFCQFFVGFTRGWLYSDAPISLDLIRSTTASHARFERRSMDVYYWAWLIQRRRWNPIRGITNLFRREIDTDRAKDSQHKVERRCGALARGIIFCLGCSLDACLRQVAMASQPHTVFVNYVRHVEVCR